MLLKTKLYAPPLRPDAIVRSQLLTRLGQPLPRQLTLIHAPAGYGKTTLTLQWLQSLDLPHAWLSLDAQDNDPLRFWRYVQGALQPLDDQDAQPSDTNNAEILLVSLLNRWAGRPVGPTLLVLDDFHVIQDAGVLTGMNRFLDNLPASLHVVMTARTLPPLHIPLRRVRNTVTEIRNVDLSFGRAESGRFFHDTLQLALDARLLDILQDRTDGWAAALQLAGLSLKQQPRLTEGWLVQESSQLLVDYLAEEVLANLPVSRQHFILSLAGVRRFNLALCQAMHPELPQSLLQDMLAQLREDNLFIVPLDDQGQWFRFHELFRDNLLNIARQHDGNDWLDWQRRAARWFVRQEDKEEAIHCLLTGELWHEAAELIEQLGVSRMLAGKNESLNWWLGRLPADILLQRPRLALIKAWTLFGTERVTEAEPYLDQADHLLPASVAENRPLRTQIAIFRTQLARLRGDDEQALHWAEQSRSLSAASGSELGAVAQFALGLALFQDGQFRAACTRLEDCLVSARHEHNHFCALSGSTIMAHSLFQLGQTRQALDLLDGTRRWLESEGMPAQSIACWQNTVYAHIHLELDQLPDAHRALEALLVYQDQGAEAAYAALISMIEATLDAAEGRIEQAIKTLDSAGPVLEKDRSHWSQIGPDVGMLRAQFLLQSGRTAAALRWANEQENRLKAQRSFRTEEDRILLARCMAQQNRQPEALSFLLQIRADAARHGRLLNQIKADVALARVLAGKDNPAAVRHLRDALQLAEEPGYRRVFLNEGAALLPLLRQLDASGVRGSWHGWLMTDKGGNATSATTDSLTQRELEVLRMIADGHRNQSIADDLHIAVTTTKAHIRNIYEKLAVNSRTQAVAKARELGLLHA